MLAYASLNKIENCVLIKLPHWKRNTILSICFFLSSFGIYIGRFVRLNSWDILISPFLLLEVVMHRFMFPLNHPTTWAVTIILTMFFNVFYFTIKQIGGSSLPLKQS
jgi:uncharacterized membrane protein